MRWPDNKTFAFSIFDDPDSQTLAKSRVVYSFLADQGLRTTIGVWPNRADPSRASDPGETCANANYVAWIQELQRRGFEIGFHAQAHDWHNDTRRRAENNPHLASLARRFVAPAKEQLALVTKNRFHGNPFGFRISVFGFSIGCPAR